MNEQTIYLDVNKAVSPTQMVRIGQGDVAGTTIRAHIFDNGVAADLTGMTARFEMRLPNTTNYVRDASCTIGGNVITYVVDEAHAASVAGITDVAYFDILDGEDVIYSTERFSIDVLRSAHDGTTPAHSWDTEIDELIERGEQAVSDAEQAVDDATSAVDAANQAIARIEPTIEQAAEDAAEQATADAEQRIQDAIDAVGDISELAVPLMSADVRGGAKLEQHGGLALRDGALGIGSLVQESDGYARGGLAQVTAKGHAEQVSTSGKNLLDVTTFVQGGIDGATGDVAINSTRITSDWIPVDSLTQYMLQWPSGLKAEVYEYSNTKGYMKRSQIGWRTSPYTFETRDGVSYVRVLFGLTDDANITPSYVSDKEIQLELGSTATEYESYTGGAPSPSPDYPQEIQVVRGRNLLDPTKLTTLNAYVDRSGTIHSSSSDSSIIIEVKSSTEYTFQGIHKLIGTNQDDWIISEHSDVPADGVAGTRLLASYSNSLTYTFTTKDTTKYLLVKFGNINMVDISATFATLQLELDSTPQPYVPYGHVGMEVRDPDTDELISCTPIPLPQRGWVAGLPDGTADSLRLDGAGKCEWELADGMETFDGSSDESWGNMESARIQHILLSSSAVNSVGMFTHAIRDSATSSSGQFNVSANRLFFNAGFSSVDSMRAFLEAHPASLLYKLATPVTEDCGYCEDWPTDIPEGATVSIPELDEVGISYFVDSTVTELARQWYARANSEYADRLSALEQAVAELATS